MSTVHSATSRDQYKLALKALYREVSKRVHPDLSQGEPDRLRREILMRRANQAYEDGDSNRLRTILQEHAAGVEFRQASEAAADPVSVVRSLTREMRLQLTLMRHYGSERMKQQRSHSAAYLLGIASNGDMPEEVLRFFDEMYLFLLHGYLNEKVLWSTFGVSAYRWWAACADWAVAERNRRSQPALFAGSQHLALRFAERDAQNGLKRPSQDDLTVFLEGEKSLSPLPSWSAMNQHSNQSIPEEAILQR